jgi:hypothetical protein
MDIAWSRKSGDVHRTEAVPADALPHNGLLTQPLAQTAQLPTCFLLNTRNTPGHIPLPHRDEM